MAPLAPVRKPDGLRDSPPTARQLTPPTDCAAGVWVGDESFDRTLQGGEQTGLRGGRETLDDVLVEVQMSFGSSHG